MLLDVYKKYPIVPERAQGKYIYDKNGKRYLDLVSGISGDTGILQLSVQ